MNTVNGYLSISAGQTKRYEELLEQEKLGMITDLDYEPMVYLTRAEIGYRSDFAYMEKGRKVYEEYKGVPGERWPIIKNLWREYGPALLRITQYNSRGILRIKQEIMPSADEGMLDGTGE